MSGAAGPGEDGGRLETAEFLRDVEALLAEAPHDRGAALDVIAGRLHATSDRYRWTGLFVRDGDELVLGADRGEIADRVRIPVGEGVCGEVARHGRTVVVDAPDAGDGSFPGPRGRQAGERGSGVVVPILLDGDVVGEIVVRSAVPAAFGDEEVEFLERVAERLADLV